MEITLSKKELDECERAGVLRYTLSRFVGKPNELIRNADRAQPKTDSLEASKRLEVVGVIAEMGVAKLFDITYAPQALGVDNGADMWLGDFSIDVKGTERSHGNLIFSGVDKFKADIGVLGIVNGNVVRVPGWIKREDFIAIAEEKDYLATGTLAVSQSQLARPESLWKLGKNEKAKSTTN